MSDLVYRGSWKAVTTSQTPHPVRMTRGQKKKKMLYENTVAVLLKYQIEIHRVMIHVRLETVSAASSSNKTTLKI